MRIERYTAADTKSAMALVRADLGPEAMILANKRVGNRVELTATVDLDDLVDETQLPEPARSEAPSFTASNMPANEIQLKALERELTRLRGILETELGDRSWRDSTDAPAPVAALRQRLLRLGLSRSLAGDILDSVPARQHLEAGWSQCLGELAGRIRCASDAGSRGMVTALFGGTGAGKTSTIAKLAGRDLRRFGVDGVGLISLDNYRIGAHEQLASFADALGIPLLTASDRQGLTAALKELRGRRVFIDTAGMAQSDDQLSAQLEVVSAQRSAIQKLLVLSASAQPSQSRAIADRLGTKALSGAIITKIDEAPSLGGVLDVVVRNSLILHGVGDGQRIPENFRAAEAEFLVRRAVSIAQIAEQQSSGKARATWRASA